MKFATTVILLAVIACAFAATQSFTVKVYGSTDCSGSVAGSGSGTASSEGNGKCNEENIEGTTIYILAKLNGADTENPTITGSLCNAGCTTCSPIGTFSDGQCIADTSLGGSAKLTFGGAGCFHEDTRITYEGKEYGLEELRSHSSCHIPHQVSSHGSIITANCDGISRTLRLTDGHLVYTQRGLVAADELESTDVLYSDMSENNVCSVVTITKEKSVQRYFGLNCHSSQVLAHGLKTSTFEKLHSVPSFWMAVMGKVLGIKTASQIGLQIQQWIETLNLV